MTDLELALYDIKVALDHEIEELMQYRGLIDDYPLERELTAKIEGIEIAQGYLFRKLNNG